MRAAALLLAGLVPLAALAGCGRGGPDGAAFCAGLAKDQAAAAAGVTTPAEAAATVARYRELAKVAPAAVRDAWNQLTELLARAAQLDPGDPAAAASLRQLAFESQSAANDVSDWARATCGIELRPPTSRPATGAASAPAVAPTKPASGG